MAAASPAVSAGSYAASTARALGIGRQDRAKMDVWVTSRFRQSPSLEWSKLTDRSSPIPGMGRPMDQSARPGLDPELPRRNVPSIDLRTARSRADELPPHGVGFEHSRGHECGDYDLLSTHGRSTACSVHMGRGWGRPPTPRGRAPRKQAEEQPQKTRRHGDQPEQKAAAEEEPADADLLDGLDLRTKTERRRTARRIHIVYDFDLSMDKVYDRVGNKGRGRGIDMARMGGREQFDPKRTSKSLDYDYHPNITADSRRARCVGGDFSKGSPRRPYVRPASRTYDTKWPVVDPHVGVLHFDRVSGRDPALDRPAPAADQYGGPHELLRPLQSKWSGLSEKMRGWYDHAYSRVHSSPATVAAPRAVRPDVIGIIRGADASLGMVRSEISTHRTERVRRKNERSELYRDDRFDRLSGRDPASSPGFRYAYSDTPPGSPGGASPAPQRAASAPVGAGGGGFAG
eukprot:TRINITY_DN60629_c0_g1_i1.p1 TRINITY_DN60629_c0_g1~~TRINITY_DN60629_c0_g1_i1.p1  ORF type:complete len:490 (+),score=124.11 TRINITY_DN60629_c0_g1_i1:95-1471(+)